MTIATYTVGPPSRPRINHDNGFLDKLAPRPATALDRASYVYWKAKLEAAEAGQNVPFVPHNDIPDALGAYRHFLDGTGTDRQFSYDRYCANDPSGRITLTNIIWEAKGAAIELYTRSFFGGDADFEFTGTVLAASFGSVTFPYPATENWQKAIGAHNFWISGHVVVTTTGKPSGLPEFDLIFDVHVEDMYNFNPGAQDIATGIPDDANGLFEVTGLAKQYLNVSTLTRQVKWTGLSAGSPQTVTGQPDRMRKPSDNRRARNRT